MPKRDIKKIIEELNVQDEQSIIGMIKVSIDDAKLGQQLKLIKAGIDARNTLLNHIMEEEF